MKEKLEKKNRNIYWTQKTEDSIVRWQREKTQKQKEIIYATELVYPLSRLTESIINYTRFNFRELDYYQNLHNDVMTHLYSQLNKFDSNRISEKTKKKVRAFSYFQTIAKNMLVQLSINKEKIIFINDNNHHEENNGTRYTDIEAPTEDQEIFEFLKILKNNFEYKMSSYSIEKKKIADAIIYFIENVQKENIYSRKHVFLLLREYTGLPTKTISTYLNEMKEEYLQLRKQYYNGVI